MRTPEWARYKVTGECPEGELGNVVIEQFDFTEGQAKWAELHDMIQGRIGIALAGRYTRLSIDGTLMMTDTPDEIRDHMRVIAHTARVGTRRVLVAGLGLGVVVRAILMNRHVEEAVVLEQSYDVIKLVGERWLLKEYGDRLEIRHRDALLYRPVRGERYDVAWFDIWPTISGDHWPEMKLLHRRWARRTGWQDSWRSGEMRELARTGGAAPPVAVPIR